MDIITRKFLRQEPKACKRQVDIWAVKWPNGMAVTEENIFRCFGLGLDVRWFIIHKLPPLAWEEYCKGRAPAWKEDDPNPLRTYNKAMASRATKIIHKFNPL